MTEETEINPLRAAMVANVIAQNSGEALTVENIARLLPDNFDLGEDDLEHYRQSRPITFEGEPEATPAATQEAAPEAVAEPEAPPATPDQIETATQRRIAADQSIANARVAVIAAGNVERAARAKLAEAVTTFQNGFPKVTREQLMRDMIASEQERKAAGNPLRPQGRPGKSAVDRTAFYGRGGNPARGDYRRGAFPSQAKGAPNYDPRRGAVAALPKVPS
jgi:hypothetical protein